ncbi:MAG: peptide chain release factor N(5)-glutamine methyltransferase [Ahrensia sp.]|nr:peptide chain release factor N(5)-glutamine methyltransferase [Ahrensia sp.]
MTRLVEAQRIAVARLVEAGRTDSQAHYIVKLLLQHILETDAAGLIARAESQLSEEKLNAFYALALRAETQPVHRLLGWRDFFGLRLRLSAATLEPRDDTEALVEAVLDTLPDKDAALRFADLGTGTGAIALALLSHLPNAVAIATDVDPQAVATATENAMRLGFADRFQPAEGSWMEPLAGNFHFVVSNPPYIASDVIVRLHPDVCEYDPHLALDGGTDGLDAYRAILKDAASHLREDGFLALEIGYNQAEDVRELAESQGWTIKGRHKDINGRNRVLICVD